MVVDVVSFLSLTRRHGHILQVVLLFCWPGSVEE